MRGGVFWGQIVRAWILFEKVGLDRSHSDTHSRREWRLISRSRQAHREFLRSLLDRFWPVSVGRDGAFGSLNVARNVQDDSPGFADLDSFGLECVVVFVELYPA